MKKMNNHLLKSETFYFDIFINCTGFDLKNNPGLLDQLAAVDFCAQAETTQGCA